MVARSQSIQALNPGASVSGDPWKSQPEGLQLAGSRGRRSPGVMGLESADPGSPSASFYLHLRSDQPTRGDPRVTSCDFLITWWRPLDKNASPRNYQRVIFINGATYQNGSFQIWKSLQCPGFSWVMSSSQTNLVLPKKGRTICCEGQAEVSFQWRMLQKMERICQLFHICWRHFYILALPLSAGKTVFPLVLCRAISSTPSPWSLLWHLKDGVVRMG